MKVRYRKLQNINEPSGYSLLPLLQVCVRYAAKGRVTLALVDSGASDCIFPESMGTVLGIDVPSGRPKTYYGLAQQEAAGFVHSIQLQVTGFSQWITMEAGFVRADIVPLLGQTGFFENYQIIFERFSRQFEVNTKVDALMRGRHRGR